MGLKSMHWVLLGFNSLIVLEGLVYIVCFVMTIVIDGSLGLYDYAMLGFGGFTIGVSILGFLVADGINWVSLYLSCTLILLSYQFTFFVMALLHRNVKYYLFCNDQVAFGFLGGSCLLDCIFSVLACRYRTVLHRSKNLVNVNLEFDVY